MWKPICAAALIAFLAAPQARAVEYPKQATYLIYVGQEQVGRSVVTIQQTADELIFISDNRTKTQDFSQNLKCRTVIDRKTFRAKSFEYEGDRVGSALRGRIWVEDGLFKGDINIDGNSFPSEKKVDGIVFFQQDYVIDNHLAWVSAAANAERGMLTYTACLPTDFMFSSANAFVVSELEFQTPKGPRICARLQSTASSTPGYWAYLDLDRGIPVYMDYPANFTEVFLLEAYGDKPSPKYTPGEPSDHDDHAGHNH